MRIGVPKETYAGERRVALAPASVAALRKAGLEIVVQSGAGERAGYADERYADAGCAVTSDRSFVLQSDVVACVRALGANQDGWQADLDAMRSGAALVGMMDPLGCPQPAKEAAARGVSAYALELLPRITRAQSMDVLSSQASLAGYRAVLMAAIALPKLFPMMMTAAGTITPSRVFVLGAGVAGLQAIATARRLGAIVTAYDVRPAVREQVESLGARFAALEIDSAEAQDSGGYAKALGPEFYAKQAQMMSGVLAESDAVVSTAAVPGKKAPTLITAAMVEQMAPGSVIVDLAAERGGNCEVTQPGATVVHHGVVVIGPLNVPSDAPFHASQLYGKNMATFLLHILRDGGICIDTADEIVGGTLVTAGGSVVNERVREVLGLATGSA